MKLILIMLLAVTTACEEKAEQRSDEEQNAQIREMVKANIPEIDSLSGLEQAKALVSFVHFKTRLMPSQMDFALIDRADNVSRLLSDPNYGHVCGGLGVTAVDVLRAYGFRSRVIQMFSGGRETHVASEAEIDGEWIAFDPTFNIMFIDEDGGLLSYSQIFERKYEGIAPNWEYIDGTKFPMETYPIPYSHYLNYGKALPVYERMTPVYEQHFAGEELLGNGR